MKRLKKIYVLLLTLTATSTIAYANLMVKVNEPKTTGQKTLIKLELKNTFKEKIESVRATVVCD